MARDHDVQKEGYMVTISDRRRPRYVNWIKGEPNNSRGNEHCVLYRVANEGWNDAPCSYKVNLVCTKK